MSQADRFIFNDILNSKPEFKIYKEYVGDSYVNIICYAVQQKASFSDDLERECRGITFDKNGNIVSRPLHKFFNINQNEKSRIENINYNGISYIGDKFDVALSKITISFGLIFL